MKTNRERIFGYRLAERFVVDGFKESFEIKYERRCGSIDLGVYELDTTTHQMIIMLIVISWQT